MELYNNPVVPYDVNNHDHPDREHGLYRPSFLFNIDSDRRGNGFPSASSFTTKFDLAPVGVQSLEFVNVIIPTPNPVAGNHLFILSECQTIFSPTGPVDRTSIVPADYSLKAIAKVPVDPDKTVQIWDREETFLGKRRFPTELAKMPCITLTLVDKNGQLYSIGAQNSWSCILEIVAKGLG